MTYECFLLEKRVLASKSDWLVVAQGEMRGEGIQDRDQQVSLPRLWCERRITHRWRSITSRAPWKRWNHLERSFPSLQYPRTGLSLGNGWHPAAEMGGAHLQYPRTGLSLGNSDITTSTSSDTVHLAVPSNGPFPR